MSILWSFYSFFRTAFLPSRSFFPLFWHNYGRRRFENWPGRKVGSWSCSRRMFWIGSCCCCCCVIWRVFLCIKVGHMDTRQLCGFFSFYRTRTWFSSSSFRFRFFFSWDLLFVAVVSYFFVGALTTSADGASGAGRQFTVRQLLVELFGDLYAELESAKFGNSYFFLLRLLLLECTSEKKML